MIIFILIIIKKFAVIFFLIKHKLLLSSNIYLDAIFLNFLFADSILELLLMM